MEMYPNPEFFKGENHEPSQAFSLEVAPENDSEGMESQNLDLSEITKKLGDERMNKRFAEELWNLESGAEFDEYWLATYHDSLAHWKSKVVSMPVTKESEATLEEITKRMALVLEALEKSETRAQH